MLSITEQHTDTRAEIEVVTDTEEWQRRDVIVAMPHPERPNLLGRDGGGDARAS